MKLLKIDIYKNVLCVFWLCLQGRLLSLLDDNSINLWELVAGPSRVVGGAKKEGVVTLKHVDSYSLPGRPGIESCRYLS